jgi:predicted PurR-regulated permease PerM
VRNAKLHPFQAAAYLAVVIASLHLGRMLFIPATVAVVLSILLAPLVNLARRGRIPNVLAVLIAAFGAFLVAAGLGLLITHQAIALGKDLPKYRENIEKKVTSFRGPLSHLLGRVQETLKEIGKKNQENPPGPGTGEPVKVEVVDKGSALKVVGGAVNPLLEVSGTLAIIFLLVVFLLIYRVDIADRIIRLAGSGRVNLTSQAMTESARGVSRYLAMQALVNGSYGSVLGTGLFFLGVPHAPLWGLLAALSRFIPYVGPLVGGGLPVLLAVGVFDGWTRPLLILGLIVALELLVANLVEPWVYGSRTGLSPFAIIVSAVFWVWVWGGIGLLLSVPLTVCLATLGKHIPTLRFLSVLLGREPPIEPPVALYHRLLSRKEAPAMELVEEFRQGKPLEEVCDLLLIPALGLVQADLVRGDLEGDKASYVLQCLREMFGELADDYRREQRKQGGSESPAIPRDPGGVRVLCLAASDKTDEIAAEMISEVLSLQGYLVRTGPSDAGLMSGEKTALVEEQQAKIVLISALPPTNLLRVRYLYKKMRMRFPELTIFIGLWGPPEEEVLRSMDHRLSPDGKAILVTSVAQGMNRMREAVRAVALARNNTS